MNRQNEKNNVKTYLKYLDSSIPHSIANFKLHGNKLIFMYLKHIAHHIKTINMLKIWQLNKQYISQRFDPSESYWFM